MAHDKPTSHNDPTLVLLPGLDGTGNLFRPLLNCLPDVLHYKVVGYPPDRMLSVDQMARWVSDRLPPGPIVLLSESFGGLVVLALLRRRPAAIRSILFCAAFAESPLPLLLGAAGRIPAAGKMLQALPAAIIRPFVLDSNCQPKLLGELISALGQSAPGVLAHRLRLIAAAKPPEQLPSAIACHYLQATRDRLVPPRAAKWFAEHFAPFHLWQMEGPHMLLQTRPRECARLIGQICRK